MKLSFPWPGVGFRSRVVGNVAKAGFPRFTGRVSVIVDAHPPGPGVRVPEGVGELVGAALVDALVAPEVEVVNVIPRGFIRGGLLRLTIKEENQ